MVFGRARDRGSPGSEVADAPAAVRAAVEARPGRTRIDGDTVAFGTRAVLVTVSLLSGSDPGNVLSQEIAFTSTDAVLDAFGASTLMSYDGFTLSQRAAPLLQLLPA